MCFQTKLFSIWWKLIRHFLTYDTHTHTLMSHTKLCDQRHLFLKYPKSICIQITSMCARVPRTDHTNWEFEYLLCYSWEEAAFISQYSKSFDFMQSNWIANSSIKHFAQKIFKNDIRQVVGILNSRYFNLFLLISIFSWYFGNDKTLRIARNKI